MFSLVTDAKYVKDYTVFLSFKDGKKGEIDLSLELDGEVFEPLKNIDYFKKFKIRGHTLSWDNGADFSPEFLYEKLIENNH